MSWTYSFLYLYFLFLLCTTFVSSYYNYNARQEELLKKFSQHPVIKINENTTKLNRLKSLAIYESQQERDSQNYLGISDNNDIDKKMPWPYFRWEQSGVDINMTSCCIQQLSGSKKGYIQISNKGKEIRVRHIYQKKKNKIRFIAMQKGVKMAVKYAQDYFDIKEFPDLYALFVITDSAFFERSSTTLCNTVTHRDKEWPPIFAQNRLYGKENLYVLIPDFSFFVTSNQSLGWFDDLQKEIGDTNSTSIFSSYSGVNFSDKKRTAVYRGTFFEREYDFLRRSLLPLKCDSEGLFNISAYDYLSRRDMCMGHQSVVTLPGNGAWSWATKYNMLCNSVTVMVSSKSLQVLSEYFSS